MNKFLILFAGLLFFSTDSDAQEFVQVNGKHFVLEGKPYYYIGANYWYGAILGSKGEGGNRKRLRQELKMMKEKGINNLRVLVGAEGPDNQPYRVTPALQTAPGVYNDTLLDGLDYLLKEMKKHDMTAVLFLHNSWEWSGGYAQYLNWHGHGDIPYPQVHSWDKFQAFVRKFQQCDPCKAQFAGHVRFILGRTNRYTGKKYVDDPAIMAWEVANEPRPFSKSNLPAFETWISETAALIKSLDSNHLVTTGSEGSVGCEDNMDVFERIHADRNVDYLTMHIWPKNWQWIDISDIPGTLESAIKKTNTYIDQHVAVAQRLMKPIVLEEFGLPRDGHSFDLTAPTTSRDQYFKNAFEQILAHAKLGEVLAGCNFWAFGGTAQPNHTEGPYWKKGADLTGDPPQEEQGLNSVFQNDTTVELVRAYVEQIRAVGKK
ncbi:MAG: cellulase family glycosylhydrolase [Saprospiraceae bacterium]|nr:cellulase family glycosylhydrolase [Saprospiraceae bacterium]